MRFMLNYQLLKYKYFQITYNNWLHVNNIFGYKKINHKIQLFTSLFHNGWSKHVITLFLKL